MHWKREGHDLEWIVRQMSWTPPWTPCDPRGFLDEHPALLKNSERTTHHGTNGTAADTAQARGSSEEEDDSDTSDSDVRLPRPAAMASATLPAKEQLDVPASRDVAGDVPCALSPSTAQPKHPRDLWQTHPAHVVDDAYGYNRIPAFWFTLNLPFNYLFEYIGSSAPLKNSQQQRRTSVMLFLMKKTLQCCKTKLMWIASIR